MRLDRFSGPRAALVLGDRFVLQFLGLKADFAVCSVKHDESLKFTCTHTMYLVEGHPVPPRAPVHVPGVYVSAQYHCRQLQCMAWHAMRSGWLLSTRHASFWYLLVILTTCTTCAQLSCWNVVARADMGKLPILAADVRVWTRESGPQHISCFCVRPSKNRCLFQVTHGEENWVPALSRF